MSAEKHVRLRFVAMGLTVALSLVVGCLGGDDRCGRGWRPVDYPERNEEKVTISQGIWGDVWFWEGNFMEPCPTGIVTAVSREMRIHELTSRDDVESAWGIGSPFYSEIRTELVATVRSGDDGFFQVELPVGWYSVFAVEDTLFYANRGDGVGNIYPVEVLEGEVTGVLFDVDYLATW